ncbi:hypothetical protein SAMN05720473_101213 [Fibrobacter sp. UWB15]|uniref:hypothetical protein n=1 Tax=unclassified Fibrobacter TaxID=2634177 RepID=UPI00091018BA|nr:MULTISPECIES: hypothetical protein [unclassified Fibrobacter]PWJ67343.1 hypothetical protein BGW99_101213 [Fibrobacter sp. UWB6]SHF64887.1 hypothetical protein SAMN05720760_101178 [Fibrobacter sp. UWB8]SMG09696.1 hypothetical protein SAMN05720473_101213 [Fibrobacter sp. UWB15]
MQANNEDQNLEYCRYYHGEQNDPYRDSFKGRAWIAEQLASERASDSAKDFLSFVAAHISKWEPYGYEPDVARYIAFFEHCSFKEKIEIARGYGLGDALQFKKPRGRTIFESHMDAGFYTPETIDMGVLLYSDGNVYIKNAVQYFVVCDGTLPEENPCNQAYFHVGKFEEAADAVKKLIKENWERISALPSKIDDIVCDGGFSHYKFLSKHFKGMIYGQTEVSKAVETFHNQVLNIFYRTNTPSYDWLEVTRDAETFVEQWGVLLDEIDADETRAKIYDFIESSRLEEDCRILGFEMDVFERFNRNVGRDVSDNDNRLAEKLIATCDDYRALGSAIFSQWRYYNHWANDVKAEFNTKWFRLAFKRLLELTE